MVLSGELGSGKTKFAEGFLSFWGLEDEVSSPTFTIVNEHKKGDINIYHLDVYRLKNLEEFHNIGGPEYFTNGICIIEWGDLIESILPQNHIKVKFAKDENEENIRYLEFEAYGQRMKEIVGALQ